MRIAFAGNPNSGKTTMYNALTGRNEKVGNWAGVTVEKKEGMIRKAFTDGEELIAVDLPGAYSMSPFTSEESVTSAYVKNENPDVIVNIVDATNLSRSLFFTTQLLELGIPMVVALNKSDINAKKENKIDAAALSEKLGCPVIETVSNDSKHDDLELVIKAALEVVGKEQTAPYLQADVDLTDKEAVIEEDKKRFAFVNEIVKQVETRKVLTKERNVGDKIDAVLTNPIVGLLLFAGVMYLVFQISQAWLGPWLADHLTEWLGMFKDAVAGWISGAHPFLQEVLLEGVLEGVIAVVGFLPLVMVMYFMIALLEDCGYMARATVVLDPIFKRVGLSGKSVIPFVIGTGCAIPAVMACRTIRNERERRATAMLAPFMPCGAKIPVIALFVGSFFPGAGWVSTLMYFSGILIIFLCALLINWLTGYKHRKSFFIIELPEYKLPSLWGAIKSMCSRGWAYIVKAGTIILVCNFVVYIMQNFSWSFKAVEDPSQSILASIGGPIAYLLVPIVGVAAWQLAAAAITGFIAKECVVGTLATCYGFTHLMDAEEGLEVVEGAASIPGIMNLGAVAALAFLVFNLFTPPCFAAIGAMNAEMKSAKWLWGGIGLQISVGFTAAYLVYQIGTLIVAPAAFELMPFLGGLIAIAAMATMIILIGLHNRSKLKAEYELKKAAAAAK
ncbi:MAG: ferrous iron transporter B [Clostridia bacterium]|nr:ferrous iron transporter B [Clostridia bacterium]